MAQGLEGPPTSTSKVVVRPRRGKDLGETQRPHQRLWTSGVNTKIQFGGEGSWVAIGQQQQMQFAQSPDFDLPTRLHFAALARMDRKGHARFGRGELMRICSMVNRSTGEARHSRSDSINRAVKKAVERGLLMESSSNRCLIVPHFVAQANNGPYYDCPVHPEVDPTRQRARPRLAS